MPIDPSIAGGYRGIQIADPMAQYAQMVAIQNAQNQNIAAQNQNALAQYQLGSAQRSDASANALSEGYRQAVNPDTGELDVNRLVRHLAGSGAASQIPAVLEMQAKREKAGLERQKLEGEVGTVAAAQFKSQLADVNTPEQAASWLEAQYKHPVLGGIVSRLAPLEKAMANIPFDPAGFTEWKSKHSMGMENYLKDQTTKLIATNRLDFDKAKLKWEQDNPTLTVQETPQGLLSVNSKTGASTPLMFNGKQIMGTGGANLDIAQKRLQFDREKFAWEKANPNKTIHEDPNGYVAIDNRTGVATPVVYGPMTGFAAPPSGAGISGQRAAPANITGQPAQGAPAAMPLPAEGGARVPGAPVSGKEKSAPENFIKADMQFSNLIGSIKEFKDEIKSNPSTSAKWLPTGADTARMNAKYISLLMGVKDLYTLGALTGPDLGLIEGQIANPASWSGKFTSKAGFEEQVKVIENMVKRNATNLENAYGRPPKATRKAIEASTGSASSPEDRAAALRLYGLTP